MWVSAIVSLLTAIFKAFPSLENLAKSAIELADKANTAEALKRKQEKDKAVDNAIDGDNRSGGDA